MKVAIRTDASTVIGTCHVMRCKTLADELRSRGVGVRFICREHPGHMIPLLHDAGYSTAVLPASAAGGYIQDTGRDDYATWLGVEQAVDAAQTIEALGNFEPDWLVVDHYGLDVTWERLLRPKVGHIFVIDDLANRHHDCDLLLNQNLYAEMESHYTEMLPHHARQLLGPRFALLRPEFHKARESLRKRDGTIRRILVFFGGVDPTRETEKALEALRQLNRLDIAVDVVIGISNPQADVIHTRCSEMPNVSFHSQISNMAELMERNDLAIGASGTSTWERCCVSLPTIVVTLAENQVDIAKSAARWGALIYLGQAQEVSVGALVAALSELMTSSSLVQSLTKKAGEICDGGGVNRVVNAMLAAS